MDECGGWRMEVRWQDRTVCVLGLGFVVVMMSDTFSFPSLFLLSISLLPPFSPTHFHFLRFPLSSSLVLVLVLFSVSLPIHPRTSISFVNL